jgi:molybdopterin molybdotransferase
MESYTDPHQALKEVMAAMKPMPRRLRIPSPLGLGRVLVGDVVARSDSPESSLSHMDGFAVRAADLSGKKRSARLRLVGEADPETGGSTKVGRGEAVRVSTGARIPRGADSVVPVEEAKESGGWIKVRSTVERGAFVYRAGADFRKGEVLLRGGSRLRAQDIGLLLTLGVYEVEVREIPSVAILATGSELYDLGDLHDGKVLNTHGPVFANMVKAAGCIPLDLGVTPDDSKELAARIRTALEQADAVLTLGGTSVGRRDLVAEAVKGLGPEVFYHGLSMDRGRVSGVAVVKGKAIVLLPGPIQGAMNAFLLLAIPLIDKIRGGGRSPITVRAKLAKEWRARPRFRSFTKVVYVRLQGEGLQTAVPLAGETESVGVLTEASGYVVVPGRIARLRRGAAVGVNLLPGLS